jgi:hypothetical protein
MQIARNREDDGGGKTIGENYAWRTYYHGGERDAPPDRREAAGGPITNTYLCPPFLTKHTNEFVVVVSTPAYRDPASKNGFLGIVGLMISLGTIPGLPGNTQRSDAAALTDASFAAIVDSRPGHEGQVLQHPLYLDAATRQRLLDDSRRQLRAKSGEWTVDAQYSDPFGAEYPYYAQRWLAGKMPITVHGKDTKLQVIVQESYDRIIGKPLVIVPLWALILRLVR